MREKNEMEGEREERSRKEEEEGKVRRGGEFGRRKIKGEGEGTGKEDS